MSTLKVLPFLLPCAGALFASDDGISAVEKPNIVLIVADDLGYGDLGCYGATNIRTPNIDRLARGGMRFTDAHSPSAVCSPSRYGLLTGRYAWRSSLKRGVLHANDPLLIEPGRSTIASVLKMHGYTTACIGKWHLGFGTEKPDWNGELKPGPLEVGFDYFFGLPGVASEEPRVFIEDHRIVGLDPADPIRKLTNWEMEGGMAARYTQSEIDSRHTAKAVEYIERVKDRPFFLYFATSSVHDPRVASKPFRGSSRAGEYGDFVQEHDWCVGEILAALDRAGLTEKTIVIYTSDNGALEHQTTIAPKEGVIAAYGHKPNGEWRGQKSDIWEGGHRVPFIVRWSGRVEAGSESAQIVCLTDVFATVASVLDVRLSSDDAPDSYNILSALRMEPGGPSNRNALVMQSIYGMFAIRQEQWKLILGQTSGGITSAGFGYGKIPPIDPAKPAGQLYDLWSDPGENRNVYTEHPEIVQQLTALLSHYEVTGRSAP